MRRTLRHKRWPLALAAVALVATGGIAYASIPDAGGVIHSCYTKSSGAWRVIDTAAGKTCKATELPLDVYSKSGADSLFLGKTQKASDSDKLDGLDATAFLGAAATAANSDKLDGLDSNGYVRGDDARVLTDFNNLANGVTSTFGHAAEGLYPGMVFQLQCDTSGNTMLVATSNEAFRWWWDDTFGETPFATPPYEAVFTIANGVGSHSLRTGVTNGFHTTTLDLNTSIGATCAFGWTLLKTANDSPGP